MTSLDIFASQRTFRALLDALAHPGRVVPLPEEVLVDGLPPALVVPLALADLGQRVAVLGDGADPWSEMLVTATSCVLVDAPDADQVVVLGPLDPALVPSLRTGSALAPEAGCRLVLATSTVGEAGASATLVTLRGPGVPGTAEVAVGGVSPEALDALAEANAAFPAGIDTFLVSAAGQVVGIPRSCTISSEVMR